MAPEGLSPREKPSPKVSVLLLTYNHEKWISQSIESVLMQQTDFDYELVVVEDCSTDRTREIVRDYQQKYPNRVRAVLAERNGEYRVNFSNAFLASQGEYVVRMDGDDYITSPHKLQKQADFLDAHPECALCFHNVEVFHEDKSRRSWLRNPSDQRAFTDLDDLLLECYIIGPAPMLRNGLFTTFPDWYYTAPWGDWPLYILSAQHGNIGYIDEVMGAYRIHDQGRWSKLNELQQLEELMKFYVSLNAGLNRQYENLLKRAVSTHCNYYTELYCRRLRETTNNRLRELKETLQQERRRSNARRRRISNLKARLDNLERQPQQRLRSYLRGLLSKVTRIKAK